MACISCDKNGSTSIETGWQLRLNCCRLSISGFLTQVKSRCVSSPPRGSFWWEQHSKCKSEALSQFLLSVLIKTCPEPAASCPCYKKSVFRKISWLWKLLLGSGPENPRSSSDQRKFTKGKCLLLTLTSDFLVWCLPWSVTLEVGEGRMSRGVGWDKGLEGMWRVIWLYLEMDKGKGRMGLNGDVGQGRVIPVWKNNTRKHHLDQAQSFPVSVTI